jgi:SAM-dependent methyltransferase
VSTEERVAGRTFGEMAEEYDRVRLGYPAELVDDVLGYLGPSGDGRRALEVGAGTGKATLAFAGRGLAIVALEPDHAMAAVLARHAAGRPGVEIVRSTFEEFQPRERFGLLLSADAWHWTDPESRWQRAAAAVGPGGVVAVFGHDGRIADDGLRQALLDAIAAHAPAVVLHDDPVEPDRLFQTWPGRDLAERPEFTDLVGRVYPARRSMSGADYLTHMATRSQCRMLPEPDRRRLFTALAQVFDRPVPLTVETVLYLARVSHGRCRYG